MRGTSSLFFFGSCGLCVFWPFFGLLFCLPCDGSSHQVFYWIFCVILPQKKKIAPTRSRSAHDLSQTLAGRKFGLFVRCTGQIDVCHSPLLPPSSPLFHPAQELRCSFWHFARVSQEL